jgi:EpsD family peptidyl-prolyl cis-trans isomerase
MMRPSRRARAGRTSCAALIVAATLLSACGGKTRDAHPGQALASVNGAEITVLQLNEEMARAGVAANRQDAAGKQLLQALIDRQLLQEAAVKDNRDRDPRVMQAVERARALIVAQAYLQKHAGHGDKPSRAEVEAYYKEHPELFSARKQFGLNEIVVAASDLNAGLLDAAASPRSLDDVAAWLDAHRIRYDRSQVTRSTADVPPALAAKLLGSPAGQPFLMKDGTRALFVAVAETREAPVPLAAASDQIAQFLVGRKNKERAAAELQRLRSGARIEYLNKSMMPDAAGSAAQPGGAAAQVADQAALERGVAGLR